MGKNAGFLEYGRNDAPKRAVRDRIRDYDEFTLPLPEEDLRRQAARCMDCGVPFCHAGFVTASSGIGCPLSNLMPEINDLLYRGEKEKAYARLLRTHPLPEFTGRVCPALCEGSCTLGLHRESVTIKNIERFLSDECFDGTPPRPPARRTGKKVAVVGSGPAGLACADTLNKLGEDVTVYERADRPGGLLTYGIPNMKLDKKIVARRIALMQKEGVKFILNADVGGVSANGISALDMVKNFDAAIICTGARKARALRAPGAELNGVCGALDYLTAATANLLDKTPIPPHMNAAGKHAVVVGGGDTGADCAATAVRQGAAGVTQLEIMPPPPDKRAEPWPLWPRVKKTDYAHEEVIETYGYDPRRYKTSVKEIIGGGGKITGVKVAGVDWTVENGRPVMRERANSEEILPAGIVITAMGFEGPEPGLISALGLKTKANGTVDAPDYLSNIPLVFAAGDARRGASLVVWAVYEGKNAAVECHKRLNE